MIVLGCYLRKAINQEQALRTTLSFTVPHLLVSLKVRRNRSLFTGMLLCLGLGPTLKQVHVTVTDAVLQPSSMWFGSGLCSSQVMHKLGRRPSGRVRSFWSLIPKTVFTPLSGPSIRDGCVCCTWAFQRLLRTCPRVEVAGVYLATTTQTWPVLRKSSAECPILKLILTNHFSK